MNRHPRRPLVLALLAAAGALLLPGRADAHDLRARVDAAADPIRVEAGYDDDAPAEGAKVTVTDAAGAVVAQGATDDRGVWSFSRPGPGRYTIVVESAGHRDAVGLEIPEAGGPAGVFERWRMDKRAGLAVGLGVLLGGTAVYVLVRRRKTGETK